MMTIHNSTGGPMEPDPNSNVAPNATNPILDGPDAEFIRAKALLELGKVGERRRADWAYNPADVYLCGNGHLQYNLNAEEQQEMSTRGEEMLPLVYEGAPCRQCDMTVVKLTDDPRHLQYKLSTAMLMVTQLRLSVDPLTAINKDHNIIAKFIREEYEPEIEQGKAWHSGTLAPAVLHYLRIERGRVSVRAGKWVRAIGKLIGVR